MSAYYNNYYYLCIIPPPNGFSKVHGMLFCLKCKQVNY